MKSLSVKLTLSGALTLASLSRSSVAIGMLPCVAAMCSGVVKLTSTTFTSAPWFNKISTQASDAVSTAYVEKHTMSILIA